MANPLKLPKSLGNCREALEHALRIAVLGEWPKVEGDKDSAFEEAPQPQAIARAIIGELHPDLASAAIAYVFRKDMKRRGSVKLGTAKKAGSELHFFADFDFVISLNWTYWRELEPEARIALIDHELMHCARNDEGTGHTLQAHDLEEFCAIVKRWGLWRPDVEAFARAIGTEQLSLLSLHDAVANLAPREGSSIDAVEISLNDGEPVRLTAEDGKRLREKAGVPE